MPERGKRWTIWQRWISGYSEKKASKGLEVFREDGIPDSGLGVRSRQALTLTEIPGTPWLLTEFKV